ncbi:hypothetical protein BT63DRAFT_455245 [Microthyrium microscopicum]|uniref:Uncharacterized protein n=1 Tax=Microthyrium microscopicum TaxID=703497 RepID=A0A6A6UDU7_9PEZI|nr:hypothetical protein BT63DRAFT_455245 [Microthyrium microscopicum]
MFEKNVSPLESKGRAGPCNNEAKLQSCKLQGKNPTWPFPEPQPSEKRKAQRNLRPSTRDLDCAHWPLHDDWSNLSNLSPPRLLCCRCCRSGSGRPPHQNSTPPPSLLRSSLSPQRCLFLSSRSLRAPALYLSSNKSTLFIFLITSLCCLPS